MGHSASGNPTSGPRSALCAGIATAVAPRSVCSLGTADLLSFAFHQSRFEFSREELETSHRHKRELKAMMEDQVRIVTQKLEQVILLGQRLEFSETKSAKFSQYFCTY